MMITIHNLYSFVGDIFIQTAYIIAFWSITAPDLIQGIQFNTEIFKGAGANQGDVSALQDYDNTTCMALIPDSSMTAWVTIGSVFRQNPTTDVKIIVPVDNTCGSPHITVVAESSELEVMFQCKYIATTVMQDSKQNMCKYECFCGSCCSYIHIQVQNIIYDVRNTVAWQLCHIDLCVEN